MEGCLARAEDMLHSLTQDRLQDGAWEQDETCLLYTSGSDYYTLLERRTVDGSGYLTIRYKLYVSENSSTLGLSLIHISTDTTPMSWRASGS